MKKYLSILILSLVSIKAFSQIEAPVKWSYGVKKINKEQAIVFVRAAIDKGWHIYSQTVKDGGPIKTTIKFIAADNFTTDGGSTAPKPITKYEKTFDMNVEYYENQVVFQQKVKIKAGQPVIKGTIQYMACNSKECLPPEDVAFEVPVK